MLFKFNLSKEKGDFAENIAVTFLKNHGLKLLDRNIHCRFGEIDIIALDGDCLVFVEVRYRQDNAIATAIETVDRHKRKKIIHTSQYYLNQQKDYQHYQYRYDVIAMAGELDKPKIDWIKNAFQA